ncbi:MAG: AAA family ATPase [Candidatus Methanoplasma sp.]|jgi:predicted AAA+ superfamily ATPase|nr:AAA family ATPase [Candidatus Methanoplasma sp.]
MRRVAYDRLSEWKDSPRRKPLIVEGVRQCGKTYLIREFGRDSYGDVAYFNFEDDRSLSSHFDSDLDPHRIVSELSLLRGKPIIPGETLVSFDEIQFCGRALTSLKCFCENAPEHHAVAPDPSWA